MKIKNVLRSDPFLSTFILRIGLGLVLFPHGAQKMLGWFGGQGLHGSMTYFTEQMGIPVWIAFLVILIEYAGSLLLILGFATRLVALGLGVVIGVAGWMVHRSHGFFMNWFGEQAGEGYEYHILVVIIAIALVIRGGGLFSLDRLLSRRSFT